MIDNIVELDQKLTLAINSVNNSFFDSYFYIFTQTTTWIPTLVILTYIIINKFHKNAIPLIIVLALSITLADQISSSLLKPSIMRLRPTHESGISEFIHTVNNYKGGQYGFVSSHAANTFALTTIIALITHNKTMTVSMLIWSILTSYSRIYLGVHYLGDIFCGAIVGIISSTLLYHIFCKFQNRYTKLQFSTHIDEPESKLFCITLITNALLIIPVIQIFN